MQYSFAFPPFSRVKHSISASQQVRIYPGRIIQVEDVDDLSWITIKEMAKPLPPGVPLDEDITNSILQHWLWYEEFKQQVVDETAELHVVENFAIHFSQQLDVLYMEATWRMLQKKR